MPTHGTAYSLGQYNEVHVAITRALPKALEGTDPKELIKKLQSGEMLEGALGELFRTFTNGHDITAPVVPTYPAVGETFELTLNGDLPENQPLEMVRRDGYTDKWKHKGPMVRGVQTRRFKLISIGYCSSFEGVKRKLAPHDRIPEGQWREAFKTVYPKPDGKGPIGVADGSWVHPNGSAGFPCVLADGGSGFGWSGRGVVDYWRWLVEVE